MIVQKQFVQKIKELFNLNVYEIKVWTALLSRGVATAGELSDIGNVPRSRCYDVLETLEKKGFIIMKIGRPIKYIAVNPEEIMDRVKKKVDIDTTTKIDMLESLKDTDVYKELQMIHKNGIEHVEPTELSSVIVGRRSVYQHLKSMLEKAEKTVLVVTSVKGMVRKADYLRPTLKRLKSRGVKVTFASPNTKHAFLKDYATMKQKELKSRFVIIDNTESLFMTMDDEVHPSYDSAVWVKSPFFSQALSQMFDMLD